MAFEKIIENLKRNNMDAVSFETSAEAVDYIKGLLFKGATISGGGSVSVKQSGALDLIKNGDYNYIERNRLAGEEEQQKVYKACIGADFYFCSTNALTENGELLNVDGFANRVSSIAFGPKKVIMIVGKNKIVKDLNEAQLRVKRVAAPLNTKRLGLDTPCAKLGHCIALQKNDSPAFTDGCACEDRICCSYLVCAKQRIKNRITVVLINEDLGF